jgi:hypothetical protein
LAKIAPLKLACGATCTCALGATSVPTNELWIATPLDPAYPRVAAALPFTTHAPLNVRLDRTKTETGPPFVSRTSCACASMSSDSNAYVPTVRFSVDPGLRVTVPYEPGGFVAVAPGESATVPNVGSEKFTLSATTGVDVMTACWVTVPVTLESAGTLAVPKVVRPP